MTTKMPVWAKDWNGKWRALPTGVIKLYEDGKWGIPIHTTGSDDEWIMLRQFIHLFKVDIYHPTRLYVLKDKE